MAFSVFQTETATLKKITLDGFGDPSSVSYTVEVDPVFGNKRTYTNEGEEITGHSTLITSPTLQTDFDLNHNRWNLLYKGREYNVERYVPFYTIGTNNLEHIELVLR